MGYHEGRHSVAILLKAVGLHFLEPVPSRFEIAIADVRVEDRVVGDIVGVETVLLESLKHLHGLPNLSLVAVSLDQSVVRNNVALHKLFLLLVEESERINHL